MKYKTLLCILFVISQNYGMDSEKKAEHVEKTTEEKKHLLATTSTQENNTSQKDFQAQVYNCYLGMFFCIADMTGCCDN